MLHSICKEGQFGDRAYIYPLHTKIIIGRLNIANLLGGA